MNVVRGKYCYSQVFTSRWYITATWGIGGKKAVPHGVFFGYFSGFGLKVEHSWFVTKEDVFRFDFVNKVSQVTLNGDVIGTIDYSWGLRWFRQDEAVVKSNRSGRELMLAPSTKRWRWAGEDNIGSMCFGNVTKPVTLESAYCNQYGSTSVLRAKDADHLAEIARNFRSCGAEEHFMKRPRLLSWNDWELPKLFGHLPPANRSSVLPDQRIEEVDSEFGAGFCNAIAIWYGMRFLSIDR